MYWYWPGTNKAVPGPIPVIVLHTAGRNTNPVNSDSGEQVAVLFGVFLWEGG